MEGCFLAGRHCTDGFLKCVRDWFLKPTSLLSLQSKLITHLWADILFKILKLQSLHMILSCFPFYYFFSKLPHLSKLFWHAFRKVCICHKDTFITNVILIFLSLSTPEAGKAQKKLWVISITTLHVGSCKENGETVSELYCPAHMMHLSTGVGGEGESNIISGDKDAQLFQKWGCRFQLSKRLVHESLVTGKSADLWWQLRDL